MNATINQTEGGPVSAAVDYEPSPVAAAAGETRPADRGGTSNPTHAVVLRTRRSPVRVTTVIAVSVVAAVAAAVSFMHMHELAARAGEGWRAWLVPLAIDGLVVAASMTMVVRRRAGKPGGMLAWTSIILGIAASLAANIAAAEPTLIGRAVAAWPPIALLLAYELLMDQIHVAARHAGSQDSAPPAQPIVLAHAARDVAAVPATAAQTTTAPASERQQDGTTLPTGTPHIIPAEGTGTVPRGYWYQCPTGMRTLAKTYDKPPDAAT
ncbi:hypothetical protein GCM10029964_060330 [Kibdelosporangium lantanae]